MITPEEGAYAFETLVRHDRAYSGYIPILGAPWLADLVRRSPWGEMFASTGQRSRGPSKFRMEPFRCRKMNGPAGYGVCWLSRPV